ncbi:MAG: c-type cytochrome [Rubripirellula sp.]|nr:c-type cytochrome [Rubripirellula sp.]
MNYPKYISFAVLLILATSFASAQDDKSWASNQKTTFTPEIHHPNIAGVTLFAQNPDIVTPVGVAVAPDGRVFVQENHTHKRNSDYEGPETDRILVFEDTDNDGVADKRSVFYEGHTFSTDLLFGPDGHLYVSTRWFIGRFLNAANKDKADGEPEKIIVCETEADYPHNGVGGLAIDPASPEWLAFGFGENLGADYTFVGSDGVRLSGGAEGGSTYRCRTDGSMLIRQSTGHWNAFGMAYDLDGNLFSTDNDPNATPPNRLLHVIPGGDYGFEYRYGRSGRHPLVCWYGENPGTLGMIGALGEAACGLVPHGPRQLLSASWTDNRVDLHRLSPKGASFAATREPFLSGPDDFRPVHFSYSADGRYLYFTDWVKLSYPVHGHGRIWRVEFKQPVQLNPSPRIAEANVLSPKDAIKLLGSEDPYVRTEAIRVLAQNPTALAGLKWQADSNPIARAHYAVAVKRADAQKHSDTIPALLKDADSEVRFVGIKWIADESLEQYRPNLEELLNRPDLSRRDLRAVLASLAKISGASKNEFSPDDKLLDLALDSNKPSNIRAIALQNTNVNHKRLTVDVLASLAQSKSRAIQREAVRSLALHSDAARASVLAKLAIDKSIGAYLRADAIAGLASIAADHSNLLTMLAQTKNPSVSAEASRSLLMTDAGKRNLASKPPATDLDAWQSLVDRATGEPNTAVGRRLFFHSTLAGCYKCHAMNGRGNSIGPDLTTIRNQSDITRDWLLKHIVDPNAEMAPYYRPQQLVTVQGKVLTGLVVGKEGKKQTYVGTDGVVFSVKKADIEERREMTTSIMPTGLLDPLNANEIRDLIAYLLAGDES